MHTKTSRSVHMFVFLKCSCFSNLQGEYELYLVTVYYSNDGWKNIMYCEAKINVFFLKKKREKRGRYIVKL